MGGEALNHHQLDVVPLAGHAPVQIDQALQRGDDGAVECVLEAQLEDGAAQPLHRASEGLGRILQGGIPVVPGHDLHHLQLLQRVDDVLEGAVVEFPGYPVPFGLPDLLKHGLRALALGDVVGDDAHGPLAVVGDGADVDLDVGQRAVLAAVLPLAQRRPPLLHDTPDVEVHALALVGHDVVERHLPELVFRVAQRLEQGVVGLQHAPRFGVDEEDVFRGLLDHGTVEGLALPQGLLLALALRKVYHGGHPDAAPGIGQVPGPYLYGEDGTVILQAQRLVMAGVLLPDTPLHHLPVVGRREVAGFDAHQFVEFVAEHLGQGTVGVDDPAVLAQHELFLGFLALPDVLHDRDKVEGVVRRTVDQGDGEVDPDPHAALADDELLLAVVPEFPGQHADAALEVPVEVLGAYEAEDASRPELLARVARD